MQAEIEFQKWVENCCKDAGKKLGLTPLEIARVLLMNVEGIVMRKILEQTAVKE